MFPLFDKFDDSNFDIDNQELQIGARTLATINREYSELGTLKTWVHGEQEADQDLNILSRKYAELIFDDVACDFDFNDAGFNDDSFGGRYYWRVVHKFTEHEFYSEDTPEFKNFLIWEEADHRFQMDIIYKHQIGETIEWLRPRTETTGVSTGAPGTSPCPLFGGTSATNDKTGDSSWITIPSLIPLNPPTCRQYKSVSIPYYKVFDAGGFLGAVVSGDTPDNVYIFDVNPTLLEQDPNLDIGALLKTSLDSVNYGSGTKVTLTEALASVTSSRGISSVGTGSVSDPIRLRQRYILVEYLSPTSTTPKEGKIDFYGVEFYRSFVPVSRDQEPLLREHPPATLENPHTNDTITLTRFKPPSRMDFPDNFWNDNNVDTIEAYGSRVGATGGELL